MEPQLDSPLVDRLGAMLRDVLCADSDVEGWTRIEHDDDWVNPVTGHGGDCGCISCHMSQNQ